MHSFIGRRYIDEIRKALQTNVGHRSECVRSGDEQHVLNVDERDGIGISL